VRGGAKKGWVLAVHRSLGGFAVIFTLIHVITLMLDSYIHFGFLEVLVPFTSKWKPIPVAFGVVSFWIIMAVEISSLLKKHLPTNLWKYIHISSLGLFMTAAIHGYMAGTDANLLVFLLAIAVVSSPIGMLTIIRFTKAAESPPNARTAGLRDRLNAKSSQDVSSEVESRSEPLAEGEVNSQEPVIVQSAKSDLQSTQWGIAVQPEQASETDSA